MLPFSQDTTRISWTKANTYARDTCRRVRQRKLSQLRVSRAKKSSKSHRAGMMLFELAVGKVCRNIDPGGCAGKSPAKEEIEHGENRSAGVI